jgi:molybdate/tungstate transport system substrate-binding protein
MESAVAPALRARGIEFTGEPGGSKKLANLIVAGVRSPDVFISVDPAIVASLGDRVASSTTFAHTRLGIGWSDKSRVADVLGSVAAKQTPLLVALATPGLVIGRTDPKLDPKGVFTIAAMKEFAGAADERRILGADENPDQIYPEEDLLARVELGEIDVGFFYRTEAIARHLKFVPLPVGDASAIAYSLAVMKAAPHPAQARAFADFILTGPGRTLLEKAGLDYITAAGSL